MSRAANMLIEAYEKGAERGGSMDWEDVDEAYQQALHERNHPKPATPTYSPHAEKCRHGENMGFLTSADVAKVAREAPQMLLLVRCGGFRCLVPADQVDNAVNAINSGTDYVRDVSVPANRR